MPPKAAKQAPPLYEVSERVLCFHGPLLYEAKVLEIKNPGEPGASYSYKVHYKGWKSSWDEWVPQDRVLGWNDENLQKQKELRDEHNPKKKVEKDKKPAHTEEPVVPTVRGQKRAREMDMDKVSYRFSSHKRINLTGCQEEDFIKRHEIKLNVPEIIKSLLVDDWENVTKNGTLVKLPRDITVTMFLNDYFESTEPSYPAGSQQRQSYEEIIQGLRAYFDKCLGTMLLYRFERDQYNEIKKDYPDRNMCDLYGTEHLLRLFVTMPELIAHTNMDTQAVNSLRDHLDNIMLFISRNHEKYILSEYEQPSS
ncbi:Esa1p-associated factor, variant 2 [Orbilia oligospora]|uniref:Chromatin modification-related protein EAF3 n=1 Tax=Orbilia oligospora TaxID=2813651 RepID=A0A8H8UR70_ORBOL|nr:Esa1p-associated factor, variant 2 [Orbilia oligospora]